MRHKMNWMLAIAILGACPLAVMAETLEEVEKKIVEAQDKAKSVTAKMEQKISMKQMGTTMHMESKGTLDFMRKDGKSLMRMEADTKMQMPGGGHEMQGKMLTVNDGEVSYTLNDMMGMKNVVKTKPDLLPWERMKKDHDLKLLPDEKLDGDEVWVIEAAAKDKATEGMKRMVYYCRKDCGQPVKMLGYAEGEEPVMTMVLTDLKIGATISPDRFKFEVPEGAMVTDMTGK